MLASLTETQQAELAGRFARDGIVRIPGVLADDHAAALYNELRERSDWIQVINSGEDKLFELSREVREALPDQKRSELDAVVYAGARAGFQYRYETIRVPDSKTEREQGADSLFALAQKLSSGPSLDALRRITGAPEINYADAQGTAYSPGDFLTGHDDSFTGKNRRAAYVLSLTPVWKIEWGGLLVMHGEADEPSRAYMPGMNVMTLFRVGQMHSVSEVTRAAAYRRYSVTGWLRAESQPA
jgi:Rps23 Pro-64 3,4-dihydroxylase Tpa1-like proline 4-hydroxylase